MSNPSKLTHADLRQFTGTEWFRHPLNRNVLYAEGVPFVAERGRSALALGRYCHRPTLRQVSRARPFQAWKLSVYDDRIATLPCEDGNYNLLHSRDYAYTDFPLDEIIFWYSGGVIYLPSEH